MDVITSRHLNFVIIFVTIVTVASGNTTFKNKKVNTYIDVSSQLVTVKTNVTTQNMDLQPKEKYLFTVNPQWIDKLSYIDAFDEEGLSLVLNRVYSDAPSLTFEIHFHKPLGFGETKTFKVVSVIIDYLQSHPKSIKQYEKHMVLFNFNVYYYSVYFTQIQSTLLYLGTNGVTSVNEADYKISDKTNSGLKYGPFFNIEPMSENESVVHYEMNSPFLMVETIKQFLLISHWGYLTIWEDILLVHTGPKFKGPFERVNNPPKDTLVDSFVTVIPENAFNIILRDEIGLISSYEVDYSDPHKVEVKIRPRFLMYGGWRNQYRIEYSLPIYNYVTYHNNAGNFILRFPFIDRVYANMVIKVAEINIILPEGARFQDINPNFELENNTDFRFCYFLDVICREVVLFKRFNLVEQHLGLVSVTYSFQQTFMLLKPLTIAVFIIVMFWCFMFYMHFTSISTHLLITGHSVDTLSKQSLYTTVKSVKRKRISEGKQKKTYKYGKSRKY